MSYLLYCDGSANPNPGATGVGIVCYSEFPKKEIFHLAQATGRGTNNFAEYMSIIIGLEAFIEYSISEVTVHMDSQLVVNQLNKKWQVREPSLKPLYEKAQELRRKFVRCGIKWIPRTENDVADMYSKRALQG
jgi:ribonuclease HI